MPARVADPLPLDAALLAGRPLPDPRAAGDKNGRGRVLVAGGGRQVPGGVLLTAEAALRAGAGKVRIATIAGLAVPLGLAMPEAAVSALAEDAEGEIADLDNAAAEALAACDAAIVGPAMSDAAAGGRLAEAVARAAPGAALVVDAAALMALSSHRACLAGRDRPPILTPHPGEMAALLDAPAEDLCADPVAAARDAAARYGAIVAFKQAQTVIATPWGDAFVYPGGGPGLAVSGSGDVLGGIVAGLAARGAAPLDALLWGVWLHGEAGRRAAERGGTVGFLARELLPLVPALLAL